MSGLISRAFLAGSADPARYCKKYPAVTRPTKGGYEIQTTPDELAAVISHVRPYLKGHRMLCLGVETLGAERFLAENMGILELDVWGIGKSETLDPFNRNVSALSIKVNTRAISGRYDVVTVYGSAKLDNILDHVKIGSFIVFIGTTVKENPTLRNLWMQTRKAHMAQLQTGGLPFETGVGVAKVLFCNPDKEVSIAKNAGSKAEGEEAPNVAREASNVGGKSNFAGSVDERGGIAGNVSGHSAGEPRNLVGNSASIDNANAVKEKVNAHIEAEKTAGPLVGETAERIEERASANISGAPSVGEAAVKRRGRPPRKAEA